MRQPLNRLRLEQLETRLALSLPASAPPLAAPPAPGPDVIWVNTEAALQSAVNNLQSGQTIVIQRGTYHLTSTLNIGLRHALTNVTIRGETNNYTDVVLLGKGMNTSNYGAVPDGLVVYNAQGVNIQELSIGAVYFHGIVLQGHHGADDVHVYHCRIFNTGEQQLKTNCNNNQDGADNCSVEYCLIEYTNGPPTVNHGGGTGYTNGVDIHFGNTWLVANNLFRGFHTPDTVQCLWNPALLAWDESSNITALGNTFIDCDRAIAFGLQNLTGAFDNTGGLIANNFIYQKPGLFSASRHSASDAQILVWDSPGTLVYNNTILTNNNSNFAIQMRWTTTGVDVENILADAGISARSGAIFTQSFNYLQATASMFVSPSTGDLHLVNNTANRANVIGHGNALAAVTADFDDQTRPSAPDIGADQYGGTSLSTNVRTNSSTTLNRAAVDSVMLDWAAPNPLATPV